MNNLKALREREGRTQDEIAREIGLSPRGYRKIENAECRPSYPSIEALEKRFRKPIEHLLSTDGQNSA